MSILGEGFVPNTNAAGKLARVDWGLCLALTGIAAAGALVLFSVAGESISPWAGKHLLIFAICLAGMIALALVDLRIWFMLAYPSYGLGVLLLLAVAVVGRTQMGAKRWLALGPLHLQPSEIIKIALVLALARFYQTLTPDQARLSWRLLIPAAMIAVPAVLVARQPDLGTAILIAATGFGLMIMAGLSLPLVGTGLLAVGAIVPLAFEFVLKPYQKARLLTFLNPEADRSGAGYHIIQSQIALGSGGVLGKGLGLGTQSQLNFLPEKSTDFIFASLAEEFGFLGCVSVLALYAVVIALALRAARLAHSHFSRLAASGVIITFTLCVLINGAMVMGLAPVVGVPMPLLSFGGTVMISMMVGFALVLSVGVDRYVEVGRGEGGWI